MKHYIGTRLKPGERLPTEHEWGQMLGVSRLVMREALQVLAGMGLIERIGRMLIDTFWRIGDNVPNLSVNTSKRLRSD